VRLCLWLPKTPTLSTPPVGDPTALRRASAGRILLRITYKGDVARLYANGKLLNDNFYNGTPWMVGLDRIPCRDWSILN